MNHALAALALACAAAVGAQRAVRALHMWQMDSYIVPRYLSWLFAQPFERYVDLIGLGVCAAAALLPAPFGWIAIAAVCVFLFLRKDNTPIKKPLDYTARAKRTLLAARILVGVFALLFLHTRKRIRGVFGQLIQQQFVLNLFGNFIAVVARQNV